MKAKIWVDADACPKVIKEILFRASERVGVSVTLVANQPMATPASTLVTSVQVAQGFDVADNYIAQKVEAGDLVITGDIPLAADVVDKGALAMSARGEVYSKETIRQRLSMRDFMETLRNAGVDTGGPKAMSANDRQLFANGLDKWLVKAKRLG